MAEKVYSKRTLRKKALVQRHGIPAEAEYAPEAATPDQVASAIHQPNADTLTPDVVRQLQRTHGNAYVQRLVGNSQSPETEADELTFAPTGYAIRLPGGRNPIAESFHKPDTRFRVPEFDRIKAAYTAKDLKIPEDVIKNRMAQLLGRMQFEKRLKTTDPIPDIIARIFPGPGKIDEAEFNKVVDASDKTQVYKDVNDANTTVKAGDVPKLKTAIKDAMDLITQSQGDSAGLKAVFGSKDAVAKTNYGKAHKALEEIHKNLNSHVTTDYNLDDPEVGLGGWAHFNSQHMHLLLEVVQVVDADETKITLIHEASHLADTAVDDLGYYGSQGFEAMTEKEKIANAAHYEELPRRILKKSSFPTDTFTPGVKQGGGVMTREDKIRRDASEHIREAWDAAVDTHSFIRGLRIANLKGDKTPFTTHKALIMEISKLVDMTIHTQAAGQEIVTMLDVTISESIARAMSLIGNEVSGVPFPPVGALTDLELRDLVVAASAKKYDHLLGNPARDKAVIDWMSAHYRALPSV